jgi:uncharacterized protein YjbI with pentapeptide repeats
MREEREVGLPGAGAESDAPGPSEQETPRATPAQWKPTARELKQILARHRGWLANQPDEEPLPEHDRFLEEVEPPYPDWRREALSKVNLSGAALSDADLSSAELSDANLSSAELSRANLSSAELSRANLRRAGLHFANLSGANLYSANLSRAKLNNANLSDANLYEADLSGADLTFANLSGAKNITKLSGANLSHANLSGAHLTFADLSHADLSFANLSGADLSYANLSGANLSRAQVSKAKLDYVDVTGAIYAPASEAPYPYVAGIQGLSSVWSGDAVVGLVQLRKLLQDAGLRDLERETTYSIQRSVTDDRLSSPFRSFAWIEGILRFVGFHLTTAYGLHPARALVMIVLLGAVLTPVYMKAMLHPTATSGIVQVFPKDRLDGTAGNPADEKERKTNVVQAKDKVDALGSAAYFSLISAVNIGFEQFTPGDWIRRLQPRDYSLEAVGWVRVVAGVQALLSVFLLAMWVLTQFGRPFQ